MWSVVYDFIPSLLVMHALVVTAQPQQNHSPVSTMIISLVTFVTLYQSQVMGFFLTTSRPGKVTVAPGDKVTLFCAVDDDYEWCKFYNPGGQFCDFEWKRRKGNITMQECQFAGRVEFHGAYDDRECGITFTAGMQDTGTWKCELEEYVFLSSRGAGRIVTAEMKVKVQKITTTTTTTKRTTTRRTTTRTTTSTESLIQKWQTSTMPTTPIITTTKASPTTESLSSNTSTIEMQKESDIIANNTIKTSNEAPKAVPQINQGANDKEEKSSMVVIGVSIVILILILSIASMAGFFIYRRRSVVKEGAVVYDNRSKTEPGSQAVTNISFLDDDGDTTNLHEFFPPNLQTKPS